MRISCPKHPATEIHQLGMVHDHPHQPFGKAAATVFFIDKNISQVAECRLVGHDARKSDLRIIFEQSEAYGPFDGFSDNFKGDIPGPV